MNKDIDPDLKVRLVVESSKLEDPITGKLNRGAYKKMKVIFPWLKERTLRKIRDYKDKINLGINNPTLTHKRVGRCGRYSKLQPELRERYLTIIQDYKNQLVRLTQRKLQKELEIAGHHLSLSTIAAHLKSIN